MILLNKHSILVLKLYSLYHMYGYFQRHEPITHLLTTYGLIDMTMFLCILGLVSLPQYWICCLSQRIRGRSIIKHVEPSSVKETIQAKKKTKRK